MTALMRAALIETPGAAFRLVELPRPEPGPGQVLVAVHASGINPLDTKIQAGEAPHAKQPLPAILGLDLAGVVEAVGPGVERFRQGDEVYGMVAGVGGHPGTLAELCLADAELLALKPDNISMREAASLPLVTITAWEGLVDRGAVVAGESVLIIGGAGGVGQVALQLARAFEAEVFALASEKDRSLVEQLGATFIDRNTAVADYVQTHSRGAGFDLVYDTVGGVGLDAAFQAVRRFGRVVSCLGWSTHSLAPLSLRCASYAGVFTLLPLLTGQGKDRHGEILERAASMVESDKLKPRLDPRHFTLETVGEAYRAIREGKTAGKLVVDLVV